MPMDPYEPPGDLQEDPGDPGEQYNYLETQEEHPEDIQSERTEEIGANWTKNKEIGATNGRKDDGGDNKDEDTDAEDDNSMQETKDTKEAKAQRYHKTNRQK